MTQVWGRDELLNCVASTYIDVSQFSEYEFEAEEDFLIVFIHTPAIVILQEEKGEKVGRSDMNIRQ